MLDAMVDGIRAHPYTDRALIVYAPERAMGQSPGHLWRHLKQRNLPNLTAIFQHVDAFNEPLGNPGFATNQDSKMHYANAARTHVTDCSIKIADDLIVPNPLTNNKQTRVKDTLDKFIQQMKAFRQWTIIPEQPSSRMRTGISGTVDKYNKRNLGMKDDIMMCFTINQRMCDLLIQGEMPNFDYSAHDGPW